MEEIPALAGEREEELLDDISRITHLMPGEEDINAPCSPLIHTERLPGISCCPVEEESSGLSDLEAKVLAQEEEIRKLKHDLRSRSIKIGFQDDKLLEVRSERNQYRDEAAKLRLELAIAKKPPWWRQLLK
jgi:hypothetical protein